MRLNMRGNFHHWIVPTALAFLSLLIISGFGLLLLNEDEVATDEVSAANGALVTKDQEPSAILKKDNLNKDQIAIRSAIEEREIILGLSVQIQKLLVRSGRTQKSLSRRRRSRMSGEIIDE